VAFSALGLLSSFPHIYHHLLVPLGILLASCGSPGQTKPHQIPNPFFGKIGARKIEPEKQPMFDFEKVEAENFWEPKNVIKLAPSKKHINFN
jgi:hypothetical protein